jgi:hypothetical protein
MKQKRKYKAIKYPSGLKVVNVDTSKVLIEDYQRPKMVNVAEPGTKHQPQLNEYICFCGRRFVSREYQVRTGKTLSCGCVARKVRAENLRTKKLIKGKQCERITLNPTKESIHFCGCCGTKLR